MFSRDGVLVRTLWSGVTFEPGVHAGEWDGLDDDGKPLPRGRYETRVLTSNATYTWEGVVGNTSDARSGPTVFHFMSTIGGMAVAGLTAFVAAGYNEVATSQARFSTADIGKKTSILGKGAQFWKVATDGERVYWAGNDPNVGNDGFVVASRVRDDAEVSFDARYARRLQTRYGMAYSSALDVVHARGAEPSGIAVQRRRPFLFVSHRGMNSVHVLEKATGRLIRTFACEAPGDLAVDVHDDLWIIRTSGAARVVERMTVRDDGSLVPGGLLPGLKRPLALAASTFVLVADGGVNQQLRAFDPAGKPLWTLGREGGYTHEPLVTDDKFDFEPAVGAPGGQFVAFQPDGSFWVGDPGCYRLQHYAADRTFLDRVAYIPLFYSAAVDPNAPTRVFANYLEFTVDYGLPLGPTNGSWRLVRNWRAGVPPGFDNQYGRMKYVTTLRNGRTYAPFGREVFELPAAGPLRDTGARLPAPGRGSSLYPDGSVRSVDEHGGREIWLEQWLTDFDEGNNPRWSPSVVVASAPLDPTGPHDLGDNNALIAGARTSTGVIVSFDFAVPHGSSDVHGGWHLGGVKPGTDRWLWRTSRSTSRHYTGRWPDDGTFYISNGVGNAGGAVLTTGRHVFYAYRGEGLKGYQTNKWRHYFDDGLFVGEFGSSGGALPEAAPEMAGNDMNASLVRLPDGRSFIYHNDESWHGGVHRWSLADLDSVSEQRSEIELRTPARAVPRRPGSHDVELLAGLPADVTLTSGTGGWTFEPAADDEWIVLTNQKTWQREPPVDLGATFFKKTRGASASLSRALPSAPAPYQSWRIDARIDYEDNYINHGSSGGQYLDVLDANDKIIARFYPVLLKYPDDARVYGNRAEIARVDHYAKLQWGVMASWQPLRISADASGITFAYAGYAPVTTERFDAGADWAHPRRLRLSFWQTDAPYHRACYLDDLTFHGER
ncbi:MAG TPA: hypothetical protein VMT47_16065 [Polyangia bacterium]|nr:hypothetical protein [Polyangia bacterium]